MQYFLLFYYHNRRSYPFLPPHCSTKARWAQSVDFKVGNWPLTQQVSGRELKATLNSLPIYWFNFFIMPSTIRKKKQILYGETFYGERILHLTNLKMVANDQKYDGLGVTNVHNCDLAMLGKTWRRIKEKHNSRWSRLLTSKYIDTITTTRF